MPQAAAKASMKMIPRNNLKRDVTLKTLEEMAAKLEGRLEATHDTLVIDTQPRWASHIPELWQLPGLRDIDRELLVAEYRHGQQQWLWATPR